jgi:hypothetical protein
MRSHDCDPDRVDDLVDERTAEGAKLLEPNERMDVSILWAIGVEHQLRLRDPSMDR